MNLPRLASEWATKKLIETLQEWQRLLEANDRQTRKLQANVEIAPSELLIMTDTVTGDRVALSVASGVVTVTIL